MSKGIVETVLGGLAIAGGVALEFVPGGQALGIYLIAAGAGMVIGGIGTMLSKGPLQGFATATRNPIAPWNVVYGRARVGGVVIYEGEFGEDNKYLDIVMVLAAHPCEAVDELLFDQQRVQIGANNTSFTPLQQDIVIADIKRVGSTVTVVLNSNIPLLSDGDQVIIERVPGDLTFNGRFPVNVISRVGSVLTFTYICGGPASHVVNAGHCKTAWPDYGKKVYMEVMLGNQALGTTFAGMTFGTPDDGDPSHLVQSNPNPWTVNHSCVGKTVAFLRLHYNDAIFSNGLPLFSFHIRGKNDIMDPRSSPPTFGYTENAALCIADYLSNTTWGFKAAYGTKIPLTELIAAANVCDEPVDLAVPVGGTEPRYALSGTFTLAEKRGEILTAMLTACGGRLTYLGGEYRIWPASWLGSSATVTNAWVLKNSSAPFRWRSRVSINNLFNGVKGTYISPVNNWQSSDFPRYAQDVEHGYDEDDNLIADGGDRRWFDTQFRFTISCPAAQRLAKIELLRRRNEGTGTFPLNMAGYQFAPLDVIEMTLDFFGWDEKLLEISDVRFKLDRQQSSAGEVTLLGTEIDVQETDPSIYFWAIGEELSPAGFQQAVSPDTKHPKPPTNLRLRFNNGRVVLTWTAPDDAYVLHGGHIEGRYRQIASPEGLWIALARMAPTVTMLVLPALLAGENFTVELRSMNAAGVPSVWVDAVFTPNSLPEQWNPFEVQGSAADALYPDEWTFELAESDEDQVGAASELTDGQSLVKLMVSGMIPANDLVDCDPPLLRPENITVQATGGVIPGGTTVFVALAGHQEDEKLTPRSAIVAVEIPEGSDDNMITIGAAVATVRGDFDGNAIDGEQVEIAGKTYTLQATLTNVDGHVQIGLTLAITLANLKAAINAAAGAGTKYAAATTANANATATASDATTISIAALVAGVSGNDLTASGGARWSNNGAFVNGTDLEWPAVTLAGYTIFAGMQIDLVCGQKEDVGTPPTITLEGPIARSTWGLPDARVHMARVKGKLLYHGGVLGATVDSTVGVMASPPPSPPVAGTGKILSHATIDVDALDDWAGRVLAIIGRNNSVIPFEAYNITGFDASTGQFDVDRDTSEVQPGDVFVVCTKGYDNSGNPRRITDAGLKNASNYNLATGVSTPHSGLTLDLEVGLMLQVIKGTGRGFKANIIANGADYYDLDADVLIGPDSVWVVVEKGWPYSIDLTPIDNANPFQATTLALPVDQFVKQSMLVGGFLVDDDGNESEDGDGPLRMVYVWQPGTTGGPQVLEWAPFEVQAAGGDALFPDEWTFDVQEIFGSVTSGQAKSTLTVTGKAPINRTFGPVADCDAPVIGSATVDAGGSIDGGAAGAQLHIQVCAAIGAHGEPGISPPSDVVTVDIPSGGGWKVTLHDIVWPNVEPGSPPVPFDTAIIFASFDTDLICAQQTVPLTGGAASPPPASYTPTDLDLDVAIARSTWSVPARVEGIRLEGFKLIHGGVIGAQIDRVVDGTHIISQQTIDAGTSPPASPPASVDDWTGRVLMVIGRKGQSTPFIARNITGYDPDTGEFTLDSTAGMEPADVFVVCTLGVDNSGDPTVITDSGLSNAANYKIENGVIVSTPHSGLITNAERGSILRVIKGKSRGLEGVVISNTGLDLTLDRAVPIDSTSVWVTRSEAALFTADVVGDAVRLNAQFDTEVTIQTPDAFNFQSLLLVGLTLDGKGNPAGLKDAPVRPVFVWGSAAILTETGHVQFGTDDDSLTQGEAGDGINVAGYSAIVENGRPFLWKMTVVGIPTTGDSVWDCLYSRDGGATWASIFPPGPIGNENAYKIRFPMGNASHIVMSTLFANVAFSKDNDIVRFDVLESGGATKPRITIKFGVPGAAN